MNENENTNTEEVKSAFCTLAAKVKKDACKLPRIEYFRVDIDKGTGSAATWHATGYLLMVKVRGIEGLYAAGTVGAAYGMNIKSKYASADEARAAGFKMKKEWGREKVKKAPKSKKTVAERVAEMTPDQRSEYLAELMKAA